MVSALRIPMRRVAIRSPHAWSYDIPTVGRMWPYRVTSLHGRQSQLARPRPTTVIVLTLVLMAITRRTPTYTAAPTLMSHLCTSFLPHPRLPPIQKRSTSARPHRAPSSPRATATRTLAQTRIITLLLQTAQDRCAPLDPHHHLSK